MQRTFSLSASRNTEFHSSIHEAIKDIPDGAKLLVGGMNISPICIVLCSQKIDIALLAAKPNLHVGGGGGGGGGEVASFSGFPASGLWCER